MTKTKRRRLLVELIAEKLYEAFQEPFRRTGIAVPPWNKAPGELHDKFNIVAEMLVGAAEKATGQQLGEPTDITKPFPT